MAKLRIDTEQLKLIRGVGMEEILSRVSALAEASRQNKWKDYRPAPQQRPFHRSQAQTRAFIGANRSGKTVAGVMEAIYYAKGRHPFRNVLAPNKGWVVGLDKEVLEDTILPLVFEYLPSQDIKRWHSVKLILELTNGSVIKFKSCDSGSQKFQSAERRWIWFDEEPPYAIWRECRIRVGANYPLDTWITMTPLLGMDWTWDDLVCSQVPGEIEVFNATMRGNPYLLETEKRRLEKEYANQDDSPARLRGEYFARGGLVYKALRDDIHYVDPFPIPGNWPFARCVDPHGRTPPAVSWVAIGPGDVHYVTDEVFDPRITLFSDVAAKVQEVDAKRRIIRSLIDPSARQHVPQTEETIQDQLAGLGLPTNLANNDLRAGWNAVREKIGGPGGVKLFVFRTCPNTWRQLKNLAYDDYRFRADQRDLKEAQRKRDDHLADNIRYICAEDLRFEDTEPEPAIPTYAGGLELRARKSYTGYR